MQILLDSGAFDALARNDKPAWNFVDGAVRRNGPVCVPAVVLAECVRGASSDHRYHIALKRLGPANVFIASVLEDDGRTAGHILGRARMKATIDAIIVAMASRLSPALVLTADKHDMRRLADSARGKVEVTLLHELSASKK